MFHLALAASSSVAAILYVAPMPVPCATAVLVKILPCFCLLLHARTSQSSLSLEVDSQKNSTRGTRQQRNVKLNHLTQQLALADGIARGLLFSMIGDAFLVWHEYENPFLLGMGAFAVGQLFYIKGLGFKYVSATSGTVVYTLMGILMFLLLQEAPPLFRKAVPFYATLLATTVWRSVDRLSEDDGREDWQKMAMVAGAVIFAVSDGSIALFKFNVEATQTVAQTTILATYFVAQMLLTAGGS